MERFIIKTSTLLMRVDIDDIVYVKADGNYCDLVLINGRSRKMTFQLHHFEENFKRLKHADQFVRVGRSLIVNSQYVQEIDLGGSTIVFGGKHLIKDIKADGRVTDLYTLNNVPRERLKELKEQLEKAFSISTS